MDSLENKLLTLAQDSNRVKALTELSFEYSSRNVNRGLELAEEALQLSKKIGWKKGEALALTHLGRNNWRKGDFKKAIYYHELALALWTKLERTDKIATVNMYMGQDYANSGDYSKALQYLTKAEQGFTNVNMKRHLGIVLGIKAWVYKNMGMYPEAMKNELEGLKAYESIGDVQGIAISSSNLADQLVGQKKYADALKVYFKAENVLKKNNDDINLASTNMDISTCYMMLGDDAKAIQHLQIALNYGTGIKDTNVIGDVYMRLAEIYLNKKNFDDAKIQLSKAINCYTTTHNAHSLLLAYNVMGWMLVNEKKYQEAALCFEKARQLLNSIESLADKSDYYKGLITLDSASGNWRDAFEHYKIYTATRDSMFNEENTKKLVQSQMLYEFEKKEAVVRAEQEKNETEILKQQAELKARRNQQYALYGGLTLVLIFAGFMYNRFKVTQQQKAIIEEQKRLVETKNHEIVDSINYAKRIQSAILPSHKSIQHYFPQSFILYMPKDIVAGDFYWLHNEDDYVFFAVADCTGHGVPGAMVSVVCNNALQRSVRDYKHRSPDKILNQTRELVIEEFEKSSDEVKDGMDISLLAYHRKTKELKWSGANSSIWIVNKQGNFTELKGDKQPIGKYADTKSFSVHELNLQTGDAVYLFTDGYKDQFGGPKGKKFKAAQMKEMILANQHKSMPDQGTVYKARLEQWMERTEQVDDVTVVGIGW